MKHILISIVLFSICIFSSPAAVAGDITILNYTETPCEFHDNTSSAVISVPVTIPSTPISILTEQVSRLYVINGVEYQGIATTKSVTGLPIQTSAVNIIVTREIANHAGVRGDLLVNDGVVRRTSAGLHGKVVPQE